MNKIYLLLFIFLFYCSDHLIAQTFEWAKKFNEINDFDVIKNPTKSVVDNAGNLITTGYLFSTTDVDPNAGVLNLSPQNGDTFITKIDSNGNLIWAKQFGQLQAFNILVLGNKNCISIDAANNIYTTGIFYGTVDFNPSNSVFNLTSLGASDIFISKLDLNGNFIWAKQLGGNNSNAEISSSLTIDILGNVYTTGTFGGNGGIADFDPGNGVYNLTNNLGFDDVFISKLDNNGQFIWAKQFNSSFDVDASSIKTDEFGNVLIAGEFTGSVDFNPSTNDFILTSTSFNSNSTNNSNDIYITKLDNQGNFIWAKQIRSIGNFLNTNLVIDDLGSIYTTGTFSQTTDFDPDTSIFNINPIGSGANAFLLKLNNNGIFVWAKQFGGNSSVFSTALSMSNDKTNLYITGYFSGTADFDPSANVFNLTTGQSTVSNVYVLKLDILGNLIWASSIKSDNSGYPDGESYSICVDNANNIYTTGEFMGTSDFDPTNSVFNLSTINLFGISTFIQKLSDQQLNIETHIENLEKITIYPNPTTRIVTINFGQTQEKLIVTLTNILGQKVSTKTYSHIQNTTYEIEEVSGIYLLTIENVKGEKKTAKIIKQ